MSQDPAIWFPVVRTGTGTDVFTNRLACELQKRGFRTEITWLPLRAEYAPWTVKVPQPPPWATVAHVNTWLHSRFLPKNLPIVATIHHAVHHPDALAYKGVLRAAYHRYWIAPNERRVMRGATQIIAVSQFVADAARQALINRPLQVIYNGIDTKKFRPVTRSRKPGESFRLLYVGGWKSLKGVDMLAPIMRELGGDYVLRYTGGPSAEACRASMPVNMYDIGRLNGNDAVASAMQHADALLFPSRSEGFGLVAVEAMACGLPVIATQGPPLDEIIVNGVNGILCARDDVDAFAAACRSLSADSVLYDAMSSSARAHSVEQFSFDSMLDNYIALYQRCLVL